MDAIKVLWKEVQMMDPQHIRRHGKPVPSGQAGSKISSRTSEHSIAKLMETLEATAGGMTGSTSTMSLSSVAQSGLADIDGMMAQSMPASVMNQQLGGQNQEAIQALNQTCSNLQCQVEQLQSSLSGVMQFMTAFSSLEVNDDQSKRYRDFFFRQTARHQTFFFSFRSRTRHSSSTSTQETLSFCYVSGGSKGGPTDLLVPNPPSIQSIDPAVTPKNEEFHEIQQQPAKRSKSPRPKTLPGLLTGENNKIPGLAQLAGTALLNSPQAPQQVKAFAKTLVEGLMTDSMGHGLRGDEGDATDVSLSLAADDSSHVDPDSLEENKDQ